MLVVGIVFDVYKVRLCVKFFGLLVCLFKGLVLNLVKDGELSVLGVLVLVYLMVRLVI